ncbi:LysR family transcriptional regulator [Nocardioides fonticola]|uniref:LysR family transcriptional regulator n=1 Tax=Nocardioides fonticola TaxID=450363 RepID=A0ABP7XJG0_9ACTN
MLDPRRVVLFRSVVRAGSISAAARDLGWTQPAVSQHLQALERSAGCRLLERGPGGVVPTEAGRLLLARADTIAGELHLAEEELAAVAQLRRGRVRLAAYPSAAATVVPRAISLLQTRHPELDVELTEAEPPEATEELRAGAVDLALVFDYADDAVDPLPGVVRVPLGEEPVDLVLPAERAAGLGRRPRLAALADDPWIVGCVRCRAHAVRRCAEAGFEPRVRHVSDDYVVVQQLVALGLGVSLLPRTALEAYRHPEVVVVSGAAYGTRRRALLHRTAADGVPAVRALAEALAVSG